MNANFFGALHLEKILEVPNESLMPQGANVCDKFTPNLVIEYFTFGCPLFMGSLPYMAYTWNPIIHLTLSNLKVKSWELYELCFTRMNV